MIRIFNITVVALFALSVLGTGVHTEAASKSVQWNNVSEGVNVPLLGWIYTDTVNNTDTVPLNESSSATGGRCYFAEDTTNVTVTYKARLVNVDTGLEVADNATLPVGTRVRIERDTSSLSRDISWFTTGISSDSPYGYWVNNARGQSKSCHAEDFIMYGGSSFASSNDYALLDVNPPAVDIEHSGNVNCAGNVCTIGNGSVTVGLKFKDTYGKFFARRNFITNSFGTPTLGCHANNVPLRTGIARSVFSVCVLDEATDPYVLPVGSKTITFNLTGSAPNNPPTAPSICQGSTCAPQQLTALVGTPANFTFTSSDPDNDPFAFGIDWDGDDSDDEITSNCCDPSVVSVTRPYTWSSPGDYQIGAYANDGPSPIVWSHATVHVTAPPTPTITTDPATLITPTTATLNGQGNPNGTQTDGWFRYSATNPGTCNDTFGTRVPASGGTNLGAGSGNVAFNQPISGLSAHTPYYYCAIGGSTSGTSWGEVRTVTTINSLPVAVIDTPAGNQTITQGDSITFTGHGTDADGDPITAYEWDTSCTALGGNLSTQNSFSLSSLTQGTHQIYLMVQDTQTGAWSTNCPSVVITVNAGASGPLCSATTINNCDLPQTNAGGSAGSCAFGYQGACSYTCDAGGAWDQGGGTNSCVPLPPVTVTDFRVCDPGAINCATTGQTKTVDQGAPLEIHWDSSNADMCTALSGNGFETGNAPRGDDNANALSVYNTTQSYTLACRRGSEPFVVQTVTLKTRGSGISLIVNPRIVKKGTTVDLEWDTNMVAENLCSLKGGTVNIPNLPIDIDPKTGSTPTVVNALTTYTLSCPDSIPGNPPLTDTARVEIIGWGDES